MPFIKHLTSFILFVLLIFSPIAIATVIEKKCGDKKFIVEVFNGFDISEKKYRLYYKAKHEEKKLFFKTKHGVILNAACIKNKDKKDLMLFLEQGIGNSTPEDRYGIFDPHTNKMLILPISWEKGNSRDVKKLIGSMPPFPIYDGKDNTFFCCFNIN